MSDIKILLRQKRRFTKIITRTILYKTAFVYFEISRKIQKKVKFSPLEKQVRELISHLLSLYLHSVSAYKAITLRCNVFRGLLLFLSACNHQGMLSMRRWTEQGREECSDDLLRRAAGA